MINRRFRLQIFSMIILCAVISGCERPAYKAHEMRPAMGTFVGVTVYDTDEARAGAALEAAFAEIERVEALMSRYRDDSEVARLNRAGAAPFSASPELLSLLAESVHYSEISGGAFDITVGPLMRLFKAVATDGHAIDPVALEQARARVGYEKMQLDPAAGTVTFQVDGMEIDLGAIAKGYAADRAAYVIKEKGAGSALVDAGGDIRCLGSKPKGEKWNVALRNPRDPNEFLLKLSVADMAVTTSGDYEQYFIDKGKRYMHIMDPRTGESATGCISATVVAPAAIQADALSTTICVLGPSEGIALIESIPGVEALIVDTARGVHKSSGFADFEAD